MSDVKTIRGVNLCKYEEALITLVYYDNLFYYFPVPGGRERYLKKYPMLLFECKYFSGMYKCVYSRRLEGPFIEMLWHAEKFNSSELFGGFFGKELGGNFLTRMREVDVGRDTGLSPLSTVRGETAYPETFEKLYIWGNIPQAEDFLHIKQTEVEPDLLFKMIAARPECTEYLYTEIEDFCKDKNEKEKIRTLLEKIEVSDRRQFEIAVSYALSEHKGENHVSGESYIFQPLVAALYCNSDKGKITALLKDIPQGYKAFSKERALDVCLHHFSQAGIDADVIAAVKCLNEEHLKYDLEKAAKNDIACEVMFASLCYECDKSRWAEGEEIAAQQHCAKYAEYIKRFYELTNGRIVDLLNPEIRNSIRNSYITSLISVLNLSGGTNDKADNDYETESIKKLLYDACGKETCYPKVVGDWNENNRFRGHCAVIALFLYDRLGGKLCKGVVKEVNEAHFFNEINGKKIDLTAEQYTFIPTIENIEYVSKETVLASADTAQRYKEFEAKFTELNNKLR